LLAVFIVIASCLYYCWWILGQHCTLGDDCAIQLQLILFSK